MIQLGGIPRIDRQASVILWDDARIGGLPGWLPRLIKKKRP